MISNLAMHMGGKDEEESVMDVPRKLSCRVLCKDLDS